MAKDKVYQKQLEKFGIEQEQLIQFDEKEKRKLEFKENNTAIVKALMDSVEGRQWIYDKLTFCGVFATPHIPGDPYSTAFQCGLQEFGHHLQGEIVAAAPEHYYTMVTEEAARQLNKKSN